MTELLQKYAPTDSWEQKCKKRMFVFLEAYPNCFERTLEIGHFTASVWLLNQDQTHALLTHHTKLDKWLQFGGHCDGDSDVLAVAIKEAQEESGIQNIVSVNTDIFDLDIHVFPATSQNKEHYHYDIRFLLQVIGPETIVQNHESKELRWVGKDSSKFPTTERSVVRMFDKWLVI